LPYIKIKIKKNGKYKARVIKKSSKKHINKFSPTPTSLIFHILILGFELAVGVLLFVLFDINDDLFEINFALVIYSTVYFLHISYSLFIGLLILVRDNLCC
jgi:hypothetical protein